MMAQLDPKCNNPKPFALLAHSFFALLPSSSTREENTYTLHYITHTYTPFLSSTSHLTPISIHFHSLFLQPWPPSCRKSKTSKMRFLFFSVSFLLYFSFISLGLSFLSYNSFHISIRASIS